MARAQGVGPTRRLLQLAVVAWALRRVLTEPDLGWRDVLLAALLFWPVR